MRNIREFTESVGTSVLENVGRAVGRAQEHTPLPVDLLESDGAYLAIFDAPGAQSSDVQVRMDGRTVDVRIDRFREFHEGFEMRFPGRGVTLDGQVVLPADAAVDGQAATAKLTDNGTLEVHIPKSEAGGTRVEIEEESAEQTPETADGESPAETMGASTPEEEDPSERDGGAEAGTEDEEHDG